MAARVTRTCQIVWQDEVRLLVPDVRFLMAMEGQGISLLALGQDMSAGRPPLGQVSLLVAAALSQAKAADGRRRTVTPDQVLAEIGEPGGLEAALAVVVALLESVFPAGDGGAEKAVPSQE